MRSTIEAILESEITCPKCGFKQVETMPAEACQFFYECRGCKSVLRPQTGKCCVFCSFGTVKCPPVQASGNSCCS
ncbi:MAG TPA: GDCCVxC domain-containing (seleno)protein [Burkholderiales bacterium]